MQTAHDTYGVQLDASAYIPLLRTAGLHQKRARSVPAAALVATLCDGIPGAVALLADMKRRGIPRVPAAFEGKRTRALFIRFAL